MHTIAGRLYWKPLVALALLAAASCANAASLQVAPTTVVLQSTRNADGLTLSNNGDGTVHAQVRVYAWTQVDGEDRLEPTTDLAISPPMLELAAGGQQLVRVVRLGPPPADSEASYRVVVDELPVEGGADAGKPGLQFVLRYSIPVFLAPQDGVATAPVLHTTLAREGGSAFLVIDNQGNGHAQVADLAFVAGGERKVIAPGLSGYVLPGQSRRWALPGDLDLSGEGAFMARINGEAAERTLAPGATVR